MTRAAASLVSVLLLVAACDDRGEASGAAAEEVAGREVARAALGPVSATLRLSPDAPRFGDRVRFVLDVTVGTGATLEPFSLPPRLGHWRLRSRRGPTDRGGGVSRWAAEGEAERTGVNIGRVPRLAFTVDAGEGAGRRHVLELAPFEVEVAGLEPGEAPELAALARPLGPLPLPPPERSSLLLWSLCGALLVLVAGSAILVQTRRRRVASAAPPIDPEAEARAALDALEASGLLAAGAFGEYYLRLTGIVRRFIERTTGVHAPEQTTEEFLREMERRVLFGPDRQAALLHFLEAADLVKFAARVPDAGEAAAALAAARGFCRRGEVAP